MLILHKSQPEIDKCAPPSSQLMNGLDFRSSSALIASPSPQGLKVRLKQASRFAKFQAGLYAILFNH